MADGRRVIEDPSSGERYAIRRSSEETAGASFEFDMWAPPGLDVPPHVHPRQQERFRVVEGALRVSVGSRVHELRPGEEIAVPPGTVHTLSNHGVTDAHIVTYLAPALRTEQAMRTSVGLARDLPKRRHLLQQIVLLHAYLDELCLPRIPFWLQKAVLGPVAAIARARGYRSEFPEYARWSDVS